MSMHLNVRNTFTKYIAVACFACYSAVCVPNEKVQDMLVESFQRNDIKSFEKYLVEGADPNIIYGSQEKDWLMCSASQRSDIRYLELAIKYGGKIDMKNEKAFSWISLPAACAALVGNIPALKVFHDNGASFNQSICEGCIGSPISVHASALIENQYKALYHMVLMEPIEEKYIFALDNGIGKYPISQDSVEFEWRTKFVLQLQEMGFNVDARYRGQCLTDVGCLEIKMTA